MMISRSVRALPRTVSIRADMPNLVNFWSNVSVLTPGECWRWDGYLSSAGYGQWHPAKGDKRQAHRVAYEDMVGPIPEGLVIDHLCRVRSCCNPAHMEPVTIGENVMRGETMPAVYAAREVCIRGHALVEGNLKKFRGRARECRQCDLDRKRLAYARNRGE